MKLTKIILLIFVAVVAATAVIALVIWLMPNKSASNELASTTVDTANDQATFDTVKKQVKAAGIDVYWTDSPCVFSRTYDRDGGKALELREKHDGKTCAGDPQFSPMIATFRVTSSGAVEWFEPLSGQYVDLKEYKSSLQTTR